MKAQYILKLLIFLSILLVFPFMGSSQYRSRDVKKELAIEKQLSAIDASAAPLFKAGTKAMDSGNLKLADSLYSLVMKKTPEFDPMLRRLGGIRFHLGRTQEGMDICAKAVQLNESAYNLLSLANCYYGLYKGNDPVSPQLYMAVNLIKKAMLLPDGTEIDFPVILGEIAQKQNDIVNFRLATKLLVRDYPDEMITHFYSALLSAYDKEWGMAKEEIMKAQEKGLDPHIVSSFLASGVESEVHKRDLIKFLIWIVIAWILGIIILFLLGKLLSGYTLRLLEKEFTEEDAAGTEKFLLRIYRFLINTGGIYYYISLPFILLLVVAVVGGLFYVFLMVGRIPIQLMLIITVGSGFTIYGMVRSLLVRIKYKDPGRELKYEEAPGLFELTREVAQSLGTRAVDEIRITPFTDLAVYERGTWKEKLRDEGERVLIIGTGILKDFKTDDFRSVLAHEYGHFSNRDTAGGEVAIRVQNDMVKYFFALQAAGQNVWWNVAFQFLRLYNYIFMQISYGATRLQEVLADRVAARTYGPVAFQNGLTYVVKRSIEFNKYAGNEIDEANDSNRPYQNLYEMDGNAAMKSRRPWNRPLTRKQR